MDDRRRNLAPWPRTKTIIRHQLAEYYRMITHLDQQIGRVLQALEETGQADNTIIVYAADHGLARQSWLAGQTGGLRTQHGDSIGAQRAGDFCGAVQPRLRVSV
ncbi:MAG: sulfatase-like hydrolase/transferase [Planctomycetaceae bacterium]